MARKVFFLIWILSAILIGVLVFIPDNVGRSLYGLVFPRNFYWHNVNLIQFLAHAVFFAFNSFVLLLLLNTFRDIRETQKYMVAFVWVALLSIVSEVGQTYIVPATFNRSGLNLRDVLANFSGLFGACIAYMVMIKYLCERALVKKQS